MKGTILVLILSLLLLSINVSALKAVPGWDTACHNATHLNKTADIDLNGTLYPFTQPVRCPYGCNTAMGLCKIIPDGAMPGEYYMLFEIVVLSMFFLTLWRMDNNENDVKLFDIATSALMMSLFFIMALQGNNVIDISTGEAMQVVFVVWMNYGLGVFSLIPFFLNMFKYIKKEVT